MSGRLRLRIALFFAALAGLCVVSVVVGAVIAARQEAVAPENLVGMVVIATFGIVVSSALIALLFDENVARPVDALAAALRARAHGAVTAPLDPKAAKHLADLSPAAAAVCDRLAELDCSVDARVEEATTALAAEKEQLAAILSEIPIAVMVVDRNHRITLYDRQCVHVLGAIAEIGLGRSIFRFLDETGFCAAVERFESEPDTVITADLTVADGTGTVRTRIRRVAKTHGYVLAMDVEEGVMVERPLIFDFSLIDRTKRGPQHDMPLSAIPFVVFDTETTGLDPTKDEIVQIGAVRTLNGRIVVGEAFDTLVNPGRPIPPASSRVHGITDEMVADARTPQSAIADFHRFARAETLVAHNAPFDLHFLSRHAQNGGYEFDAPVLDTVLLSAAIFGTNETHTLDAIAERLGITIEGADRHTAMGDAVATAQVLLRMIPMLGVAGVVTLGEAIAAMRRHQRLMPQAKTLFRSD